MRFLAEFNMLILVRVFSLTAILMGFLQDTDMKQILHVIRSYFLISFCFVSIGIVLKTSIRRASKHILADAIFAETVLESLLRLRVQVAELQTFYPIASEKR